MISVLKIIQEQNHRIVFHFELSQFIIEKLFLFQ